MQCKWNLNLIFISNRIAIIQVWKCVCVIVSLCVYWIYIFFKDMWCTSDSNQYIENSECKIYSPFNNVGFWMEYKSSDLGWIRRKYRIEDRKMWWEMFCLRTSYLSPIYNGFYPFKILGACLCHCHYMLYYHYINLTRFYICTIFLYFAWE